MQGALSREGIYTKCVTVLHMTKRVIKYGFVHPGSTNDLSEIIRHMTQVRVLHWNDIARSQVVYQTTLGVV